MKRRGFTLIELMVVIAIIIILAAIAIPNYLNMTKRANKSRIASDMATIATGLETFKTDWGTYPIKSDAYEAVDGSVTAYQVLFDELTGVGYSATSTPATPAGAAINKAGATNAVGETNPATWSAATPNIEYIKAGTMKSILDPLKKTGGTAGQDDGHIYYKSNSTGTAWVLVAYTGETVPFIYRTDSMGTVSSVATQAGATP